MEKLSEPELCVNESSDYFQRPHFAVDVMIEGGTLAHIEITAFQTGSGMALGPTTDQQKVKTDPLAADEGDSLSLPPRPRQ